jgi:hypothetical protein
MHIDALNPIRPYFARIITLGVGGDQELPPNSIIILLKAKAAIKDTILE